MAVKKADEYQHNNPNNAFVDADFVRGGGRVVDDRAALYALASKADQLKQDVTKVRILSDAEASGAASEVLLVALSNVGNINGWAIISAGGVSQEYVDEADALLQEQINELEQNTAVSQPFFSADPSNLGELKGYDSFELAANTAGNYNFVQIQTATPVELTQDLTVLGLSLRGYSRQTTIIGVPPGRTFTINGSLELYNMRLEASPGPGSLTYGTIIGLPSQLHASQLNGPFSANNATCTAIDSDLSIATLTGPGTLVLLGNTDYTDAQITAATAAGMTVVDKRPNQRVTTANDIEITDPTKGIIMTVGSTRVRAQISGTAGARTWTFTDL